MKRIKKEYYFIAILLIMFILLTFFVVGGKLDMIDKLVFNNVIKLENSAITKTLYVITSMASTIGILILTILTAIIFIRKKRFSDFKYVIANVSVGVILMQVLKQIPGWSALL